jgi:hypothetical protein
MYFKIKSNNYQIFINYHNAPHEKLAFNQVNAGLLGRGLKQ